MNNTTHKNTKYARSKHTNDIQVTKQNKKNTNMTPQDTISSTTGPYKRHKTHPPTKIQHTTTKTRDSNKQEQIKHKQTKEHKIGHRSQNHAVHTVQHHPQKQQIWGRHSQQGAATKLGSNPQHHTIHNKKPLHKRQPEANTNHHKPKQPIK